MRLGVAISAAVLLSVPSSQAMAQVKETTLTRPTASYQEPFSSIRGFRALPDGKVLVSDGIEQTLQRIDLAAGRAETLGRSGAGPGEYRDPDLLLAVEDGRTILMDLGNGRLTLFDPAGRALDSYSMARGSPGQGTFTLVVPSASDARGRLYFRGTEGPGGERSDSGAILRYDRSSEAIDTVARFRLMEVEVSTSGSANNRSISMRARPYTPEDGWTVAPDGAVVIARAAEYRVEWILPGGRRVRGNVVSTRPVPVRDAEKDEFMAQAASGLSMMVMNDNGRMDVRFSRGGRSRRSGTPQASDYQWPDTKPPITGGVWVSTAGDAWVERSVPAGAARVYDVFGRDGAVKQRVTLPQGRRLLGFAPGAVFTRYTDEDGLEYLERYSLDG